MTTTREFVDSHLRCTHCGKKKVIEQDLDGREIHTCLNGCGKPEYVDAAGFVRLVVRTSGRSCRARTVAPM